MVRVARVLPDSIAEELGIAAGTELISFAEQRIFAVTPNVFVGLTNGSPDWGAGIELSWKFGRW